MDVKDVPMVNSTVNSNLNEEFLDLAENNFEGSLPAIDCLTRLTTLLMTENQFTGSIPTWIGNLRNLKELNMGEFNL